MKRVHTPLMDAAPVRDHLLKLTKAGMRRIRIAELSGVTRSTIDGIIGKRNHTPYNKVTDYVGTSLLAVSYEPPEPLDPVWYLLPPEKWVGTHRRLQALAADGFSYQVISEITGVSAPVVYRHAVKCTSGVHVLTEQRVKHGYNATINLSPEDFGICHHQVKRLKGLARQGKDFAPRICWDDDTIEDPAAIPEWTGMCGTSQGFYLHRRHNIPACRPCKTAHTASRKAQKDRQRGR